MNKVILIAIIALVLGHQTGFGQNQSASMRTATMLEKKGDLDGAVAIYQAVLKKNPRDSQSYRKLKNLYRRQENYSSMSRLIEERLKIIPNDLQSHVELGEAKFLAKDIEGAKQIWNNFESSYGKNIGTYRMLLYMFSRLSLIEEMEAVVQRGRSKFQDPSMFAMDLANYYNARRTYDKALDEYTTYILANPRQKKMIIDKILLMSDEPENHSLIEHKLRKITYRNESVIKEVLAAFYFKTGQYEMAYLQHQALGFRTIEDQTRWLNFAESLRLEEQYPTAIRAYEFLLSQTATVAQTKTVGQALLGLGKTFEDQIIPKQGSHPLIQYFPDNVFFEDHFYGSQDLSTVSLKTAFHLYDSVLVRMPASSFSAPAHFRLGEIQYRITRDFDGALRSYQAALRSAPKKALEDKIRLRIGDLFLAKGDLGQAAQYFQDEQTRGITFSNRLIQTFFLSGELDTTMVLIENALKSILPTAPVFNDLMELRDLIQQHYLNGSTNDQTAFKTYILAEMLMRQHKLSESAEILSFLQEQFPEASIVPLAILREALIRLSLNQIPHALTLAENLTDTELADRGWVLSGEIIENIKRNPKRALEYYHKVLEDFPKSILVEPVRFHVRKLNELLES